MLIYFPNLLQSIMQCDTCGLVLDSIDPESQIIRGGKFSHPYVFCDRHIPVEDIPHIQVEDIPHW